MIGMFIPSLLSLNLKSVTDPDKTMMKVIIGFPIILSAFNLFMFMFFFAD